MVGGEEEPCCYVTYDRSSEGVRDMSVEDMRLHLINNAIIICEYAENRAKQRRGNKRNTARGG